MRRLVKEQIVAIHTNDAKIVMATSGAGTKALSWILEIPGASNTLLEGIVPYSSDSMSNLIGEVPKKSVSEETAIHMARASYFRAARQRTSGLRVMGISCTAALTTNRERRGRNQAYLAFYGQDSVNVYHLEIDKNKFERVQEEIIISEILINRISFELLSKNHPMEVPSFVFVSQIKDLRYESCVQALLAGHIKSVQIDVDGSEVADKKFTGGILSGSFNPAHDGHRKLSSMAGDILKCETAYEISVANVDKPNLSEEVISERSNQFIGNSTLLLTVAPLFSDKSLLYPGSTFLIGWDTAVRLVDQKYYEGNVKKMYRSLEQIERGGCRFLVAGRERDGQFMRLSDVRIPERFQALFIEIPESKFRMDISSTDIRTA